MSRLQLDSLDCRILKMLAANSRVPFLEIARECGVSGAAIHQRIQKLYVLGAIRGFQTMINPEILGYDTCAYVGFYLNNPNETDIVAAKLREIPEVVECHYTTGRHDLLIKIYARNNAHLLNIIHDKISPIGAGRTETLISFKEEFSRQVPIGDNPPQPQAILPTE
ncbi:MAG: AsnC family transcriptional regulator [Bacteroides sp.]|nr:AsnC family transcriptional regulator [Bacteroides sp.]